jgi:hypothetical protein
MSRFRERMASHQARQFSITSNPEEVAVYDPVGRRWVLIKEYRIVATTTILQ